MGEKFGKTQIKFLKRGNQSYSMMKAIFKIQPLQKNT